MTINIILMLFAAISITISASSSSISHTEISYAKLPSVETSEASFTYNHVEKEDWFSYHLEKLIDLEIIDGYPDGSFRPSKVLTKAEFIKLLVSGIGLDTNIDFPLASVDTSHWAEPYLEFAISNKIMEKNEVKNIDSPISRQEMAKFIYKTLLFLGEDEINKVSEYIPYIKDYPNIPLKFQKPVLNIYGKGIISGDKDGSFRGSHSLTRAEAWVVILAIIDKEERQDNHQPLTALMYHHLLPDEDIKNHGWEGNNSVFSVGKFEDHMSFLHDNGYKTISLKELDQFLSKGTPLPEKAVVITFDDGYLSNLEYAYPIMKKYGFTGSIFLIGKASDRPQSDFSPKGLQYIEFDHIDEYADVFEFGSHTYDLHRQIKGSPTAYKDSLKNIETDFQLMKGKLKTTYMAYPYGAYNSRFLKLMKNEGFTLGFTVEPAYINSKTRAFEIPRFGIKQTTSLKDFEKIILNLK